MKAIIPVALLTALALPGPSQAQGYRHARPLPQPRPIDIAMTDDGFVPARAVLRRGAPYVLRVVNRSSKGHNLEQKAFFRLAAVAPEDEGWTRDGRISLRPGESAIVHLRAPLSRPGGTFEFSSTVLGDAGKDYRGVFAMR